MHWGAFFVDSGPRFGYASGSVQAGVVPTTVLTQVLEVGACTIWRRENPYCEGGCDPGYTCDLEGACAPYPESVAVGTVTVEGLVQPVSMEPVAPGNTYFDTTLPNPPWVPGSLLLLRTGGGAYPSVTLSGVAPMPLLPTDPDWVVAQGEDLTVTWDVPAAEVRTEVVLGLRIDQHGLTPSKITCSFPDTGSGTIPAEVLDTLIGFGVTGYPAGDLIRRTADSAPIGDGCVDFVATSTWLPKVSVAGYTPCDRQEDCPEGETCNVALQRCE